MTPQTDISRLLELWLVDDEPDVLPERVLGAVAGRLPRVRQLNRSLDLFGSWRSAAVAASLVILAAGSAIGYGLWQQRPPITVPPSPSSSATPTFGLRTPFVEPTLHPVPSYSIPPVEVPQGSENELINGRVQASGLGRTISVDVDGWRNPPGFMFYATMEAIIQAEGGSLGLWGLIRPQSIIGRTGPAVTAVLRPTASSDLEATIEVEFIDTPDDGIMGLARRAAEGAYAGGGIIADVMDLPAGHAVLIRTNATVEDSGFFEFAIYLVDLGDTTLEITFGVNGGQLDSLQAQFQQVVRSVRLVN